MCTHGACVKCPKKLVCQSRCEVQVFIPKLPCDCRSDWEAHRYWMGGYIDMPRAARKQMSQSFNPEEYYRKALLMPFLNHVVMQVNEQFKKHDTLIQRSKNNSSSLHWKWLQSASRMFQLLYNYSSGGQHVWHGVCTVKCKEGKRWWSHATIISNR